jgi:hypothetical protein
MRIFENLFPDQAEQTHTKYFLMGDQGRGGGFFREAYHGGRTELFKKKLINGFSYDVTILYTLTLCESFAILWENFL